MKVYFGTDHAGFELKNILLAYVRDKLGYEVEDMGATVLNVDDDYPDFIHPVAQAVSEHPNTLRGIILGGSGQGEAMVANKYPHVRATVYYGSAPEIVNLSREHNDANILSLGARFLSEDEAKEAVSLWLAKQFSGVDRHQRRINKVARGNNFDAWNEIKQVTDMRTEPRNVSVGDVVFIRMGKNVGYEEDGKGDSFLRPVVVLRKYNKSIFTGIPLTTKEKTSVYYYDMGLVGGVHNHAIVSQLRLYDTKRVEYPAGHAGKEVMRGLRERVAQVVVGL